MTSSCATSTEQRHRQRTYLFLTLTLSPLSPSPHLYHVFPILSGCLTTRLLHQTQTAMQSCSPICTSSSLPLFLYGPLELSVCCQQSRSYSRYCSTLSIVGLTETWIRPEDSPTPAALPNNFSFFHTPVRLGRAEVLVFSFLTIGNTQLILPYAIITRWNIMLLL